MFWCVAYANGCASRVSLPRFAYSIFVQVKLREPVQVKEVITEERMHLACNYVTAVVD